MTIEMKNLGFSYTGKKTILRDINLHLDSGEVTCIVGPNGSGKTTLIKCINNLLKPCQGEVLFDGRKSSSFSLVETAKLIGYVPQSQNQLFAETVFDTVLMGRRPYNVGRYDEEDFDIAAEVLMRLQLDKIALRVFNQLSGGQQQQVLFARALAQRPKILLLDEPTSALDIARQLEVMDLIQWHTGCQGITVVMIVHDLNLAARYASRIVMLKSGRIFDEGAPSKVFNAENFREVYHVDADISSKNGKVMVAPISSYPGTGGRNVEEKLFAVPGIKKQSCAAGGVP